MNNSIFSGLKWVKRNYWNIYNYRLYILSHFGGGPFHRSSISQVNDARPSIS